MADHRTMRSGDLVLSPELAKRSHRSATWLNQPLDFDLIRTVDNQRTPVVFHFPRVYNFPKQANYRVNIAHWGRILRHTWQRTLIQESDFNDITVVTWNNKGRSCLLEAIAERLKLPLLVLGKGTSPWRNYFKISLTLEALASIKTKFFFALDGNDCVLTGPPQHAIARLADSGAEMLFGAQTTVFPKHPEFVTFQRARSPRGCANSFLNSGQYIASTAGAAELIAEAEKTTALMNDNSDQDRWQQMMHKHPNAIQLDYARDIFYVCTTGMNSGKLLEFL